MDSLGLPYRALSPSFEEHLDPSLSPAELARQLALGKARSLVGAHPDAVIVGADQVCVFEGEVWGKPRDLEDARAKLQRLSGKTHELITGVVVLAGGREQVEHEVAHLTVYALSEAEQEGYLATREWEGCAGGYRVEGRGRALFSEIRGDLTNVLGLPMTRLVRMLRQAGVRFFEPAAGPA